MQPSRGRPRGSIASRELDEEQHAAVNVDGDQKQGPASPHRGGGVTLSTALQPLSPPPPLPPHPSHTPSLLTSSLLQRKHSGTIAPAASGSGERRRVTGGTEEEAESMPLLAKHYTSSGAAAAQAGVGSSSPPHRRPRRHSGARTAIIAQQPSIHAFAFQRKPPSPTRDSDSDHSGGGGGRSSRSSSSATRDSVVRRTSPSSFSAYVSAFRQTQRRQSRLSTCLALCYHLCHLLLFVLLLSSPIFMRSVSFSASTMSRTLLQADGYIPTTTGKGNDKNNATTSNSVAPSSSSPMSIESIWSIHDERFYKESGHRVVAAPIEESFTPLHEGGRQRRNNNTDNNNKKNKNNRPSVNGQDNDNSGSGSTQRKSTGGTYITKEKQQQPSNLVSPPPLPEGRRTLPERKKAIKGRGTSVATIITAWESSALYSSPLALLLYYYFYCIGCLLILFVLADGRITGHLSVWRLVVSVGEAVWFVHHGGHSVFISTWLVWLSHAGSRVITDGADASAAALLSDAFSARGTPYALVNRLSGDVQLRWYYYPQGSDKKHPETNEIDVQALLYKRSAGIGIAAQILSICFLCLIALCILKDLYRLLEALLGVRALSQPEGFSRCPLCSELWYADHDDGAGGVRSILQLVWDTVRCCCCSQPLASVMGIESGQLMTREVLDGVFHNKMMRMLCHWGSEAPPPPPQLTMAEGASYMPGAHQDAVAQQQQQDSSEEDLTEGGIVKVIAAEYKRGSLIPGTPGRKQTAVLDNEGKGPHRHRKRLDVGYYVSRSTKHAQHRCPRLHLDASSTSDDGDDGEALDEEAEDSRVLDKDEADHTDSSEEGASSAKSPVASSHGSDHHKPPHRSASRRRAVTKEAADVYAGKAPLAPSTNSSSSNNRLQPFNCSFNAQHQSYGTMDDNHRPTRQTTAAAAAGAFGVDAIVSRAVYEPVPTCADEFRPGNAFPSYDGTGWVGRLLYTWISPLTAYALLSPQLLRHEQFLPSLPEHLTSLDHTAVPAHKLWVNRKVWFRHCIEGPARIIPTDEALERAEEALLQTELSINSLDAMAEEEDDDEETESSENQTMVILGKKPLTHVRFRTSRPRRDPLERMLLSATTPLRWACARAFYYGYIATSHVLQRSHEQLVQALLRDRLSAMVASGEMSYMEQVETAAALANMQQGSRSQKDDENDEDRAMDGFADLLLKPHLRRQLALHDVSLFHIFAEHRCGRRFLYSAGILLLVADVLLFVGVYTFSGLINAITASAYESRDEEEEDATVGAWSALTWCFSLCCVFALHGVTTQWYYAQLNEAAMEAKAAVRTLVLHKVLSLPLAQRTFLADKEIVDLADRGAVNISEALMTLHLSWSNPLCVLAACVYMACYVGWRPAVAVLIAVVLSVSLLQIASTRLRQAERAAVPCPAPVVALTQEVIRSLRLVKAQLLEGNYLQCIGHLRRAVLRTQKRASVALFDVTLASDVGMFITVLVCFATAAYYYNPMEEEEGRRSNLFTATVLLPTLALLMCLWSPLTSFPVLFYNVIRGYLSMKHMEAFLRQSPERFVSTWVDLTDESRVTAGEDDQHYNHRRGSVICHGCAFTWQHDLTEEDPYAELADVHMELQPGELVVCQGPSGAGKSTLLLAMLGEVNRCVDMSFSSSTTSARGGGGGGFAAQQHHSSYSSMNFEVEEEPEVVVVSCCNSDSSDDDNGEATAQGTRRHTGSTAAFVEPTARTLSLVPPTQQQQHQHESADHSSIKTHSAPTSSRPSSTSSSDRQHHHHHRPTEGFLVFGSCAYCGEEPWLQNNTIKANIVSGGGFVNAHWYRRVTKACALDKDFAALPHGDETVVGGDKGAFLTRSQQARIALARALFTKADIYLLDGVLTWLDAPTQEHIIREVIHKLLRKKTVIMASNVGLAALKPHRIFTVVGDGQVREDTYLYQEVDDSGSFSVDVGEEAGEGPAGTRLSPPSRATPADMASGTAASGSPPISLPTLYAEEYVEESGSRNRNRRLTRHGSDTAIATGGAESNSGGNSDDHSSGAFYASSSYGGIGGHDDDDYDDCYRRRDILGREIIPDDMEPTATTITDAAAGGGGRFSASSSASREEGTTRQGKVAAAADVDNHNKVERPSAASSPQLYLPTPDSSLALRLLIFVMGREAGWVLVSCLAARLCWVGVDVWIAMWLEQPAWVLQLQQRVAAAGDEGTRATSLLVFFVGIIAIATVALAVSLTRARIFARGIHGALHAVYILAVGAVLRGSALASNHSSSYLSVSQMIRVLVHDVSVLETTLPPALAAILSISMQFAAVALFSSVVNPFFFLFMPLAVMLFCALTRRFYVAVKELKRLERRSFLGTMALLMEVLQGAPTARCFSLENRILEEYCLTIDTANTAAMAAYMAECWVALRTSCLVLLLVAIVGVWGVLYPTTLLAAPSYTGVALLLCIRSGRSLSTLCNRIAGLRAELTSLQRLVAFLWLPAEPQRWWFMGGTSGSGGGGGGDDGGEMHRSQEVEASTSSAMATKQQHSVSLEYVHVSARYGDGLPWALRDVSLAVRAGERVGIIGLAGHGKSSLFSVVLRLVEEVQGSVYINGMDAGGLASSDLRRRCALIPQAPLIPPETWRSYLLSGHDDADADANASSPASQSISDQKLWSALRAVGLASTVAFMGGLDADVPSGGGGMPAFQRQLLCVAKAVLHPPSIVLLEDVSAGGSASAVDVILEHVLGHELRDSTALIIANRTNTLVSLCSRVVMMEEGRLTGTLELGPLAAGKEARHQALMRAVQEDDAVAVMINNLGEEDTQRRDGEALC